MVLHVLFDKDGSPSWIGSDPRVGSEPVEDLTLAFLAGHRRTTRGKWVVRTPAAPVQPTPEEEKLTREAAYQAQLAARDAELRQALSAEADPQFFRWQRGEVTKEDWLASVEAVKARFPKPDML
jgi:hypothetical protein